LRVLGIDGIVSHGYSALVEILYKCERAGVATTEVPITFADRIEGRSKISRSEIYRGIRTVIMLSMGRLGGQTQVPAAAEEFAPLR
jgi:dolichol-phosphate mannosyltransferase